jgi:hypothetical protein
MTVDMGLLFLVVAMVIFSAAMLPMLFIMAAWYELELDRATAQKGSPWSPRA